MLHLAPAELIRDTIEGFNIDTDLDTIDRINENLNILINEREEILKIEQNQLKLLSDQLNQNSLNLNSLENSNNRLEIKSSIKQNQSKELSINKNLRELTTQKQDLSTSLSLLLDEFNELNIKINNLENLKKIDELDEMDKNTLKLSIYEKFGIKTNEKSELIIYNKEKNFNDYLNFGDEKLSDFFISNYIWDKIE
ncbi:putative kinetochore protein [Wickerhamomyces ciferrii]|uniref:Kinetochore protein Spc24 n=1 Tax=Wickerhamomyces ciferrii (strain ATCC 14091 / BCRC 22168 / CBS 111 / JCM 3599 / NBRC 0793 / NRRL Y-1031 F-60-10) TaxID=1206466 RepID=K0KH62_WICCF|nr:putative kinetochore protein [Wickerhamomyces ciferrii]CCH40513.1 putative kinetochore protein [Wickerhamomyces ciferrii]